jgi:replicative DNA helicase
VIDHLHRLVYKGKGTNFTEEIGNTVIPLKEMAVRLEMVIFLICHISQEATKKLTNGEELGLGAVRDSSFVEQDADVVLYTWRMRDDNKKNIPNANIMKLAKNRHNGEIDVSFPLRFQKGLYYEMARDEYEKLTSPPKPYQCGRKPKKADPAFVHEE